MATNTHASVTAHRQSRTITGLELRSVLVTFLLGRSRPCTVGELCAFLESRGVTTPGRVSKDVSDALRWEIGRGRVRRVARGMYMAMSVPRTTAWRMRKRAMASPMTPYGDMASR